MRSFSNIILSMTLDQKPRAWYFATVKTQFWVKNSHFWVEMAIFGDFTYLRIRFLVKFADFLDFFANKSFWTKKKFHLFFWVFWVDCTDTFSSKRIWPGADFERTSSRIEHFLGPLSVLKIISYCQRPMAWNWA